VPTFEYSAVGADGALVVGRANARDELELDRELESRGATLASARTVTSARSSGGGRLNHVDLISLTTQLATISGAGVHIVEGLEGIAQRMARAASREVLEDVVKHLRAGLVLSEALDRHPRSFPDIYRASLRAGEASGSIDKVLLRLAKYLEWSRGIRGMAIQALIYPSILMLSLVGLVMLLLYFVLPRLLTLFPGGPEDLPEETRLVMGISNFVVGNALWLGLAAGFGIASFIVARRTPLGRERIDAFVLRLPGFGKVARQLATSRFSGHRGPAAIGGLRRVHRAACRGLDLRQRLDGRGLRARVRARPPAARRSRRRSSTNRAWTSMLVQMVAVGEKSGELDRCLERLAAYYDEEVPRIVRRFLALLEPTLLVGSGVIVGFILLAALAPIFKLYETLG
jgi:type II secretory pathway component PulF